MTGYRRVVLASRPAGAPTLDNFRIETGAMPGLCRSGSQVIDVP
jgi:hypothetical protein